jgi:hypothetical protein
MNNKLMNKNVIPITYNDWDTNSIGGLMYYDCVLTDNFGEFIEGDKFPLIVVDFLSGAIDIYADLISENYATLNFKIQLI